MMWNVMKVLVETSCAAVLAAVLKNKDKYKNNKIGIIISGGNVDFKPLLHHL
jgi:threonine dehydratase